MKKIIASIVVALLLNLVCVISTPAASKAETDAQAIAKVKSELAKLGTGPSAYIELKLRDGRKLKGYLSEVADEHFSVVDEKSGAPTEVAYPQVSKIKGHNLSTGAKVGIGVAIGVAVLLFVLRDHIRAY